MDIAQQFLQHLYLKFDSNSISAEFEDFCNEIGFEPRPLYEILFPHLPFPEPVQALQLGPLSNSPEPSLAESTSDEVNDQPSPSTWRHGKHPQTPQPQYSVESSDNESTIEPWPLSNLPEPDNHHGYSRCTPTLETDQPTDSSDNDSRPSTPSDTRSVFSDQRSTTSSNSSKSSISDVFWETAINNAVKSIHRSKKRRQNTTIVIQQFFNK